MIHEPALVAVTGELRVGSGEAAGVLRSPGLLTRHYAPRARLECWSWADEGALRQQALGCGVPLAKVHVISHTRIPSGDGLGRVSVIPHDPEAFARALYAELHQCDEAGAELIVVEAPPHTPEWSAIADRLRRAAARE
jgi:L-threonylcarbamoyladenylate synthase